MIKNITRIFNYEGGEIQRVQCVYPESWESLDFFNLGHEPDAFPTLCDFYQNHVVSKHPAVFGRMVLFKLRDEVPIPEAIDKYADPSVLDPLLKVASALRKTVRIRKDSSVKCTSHEIKAYLNSLVKAGCLKIISGLLPHTVILPVSDTFGFMTRTRPEAKFKVNASFFVMDCFDVASPYDSIGTPFGMCIKDGVMISPPLFNREALFVKKTGRIEIQKPDIGLYRVSIGETEFIYGGNAEFFQRPFKAEINLKAQTGIAIIGRRVVAVKHGGRMSIPASGFLIRTSVQVSFTPGTKVTYKGCEDILFGIQAGNSIIRNGMETTGFISKFYDIKKPWTVAYPPSLYPLNYSKSRAARVAIGADKEGNPMIVWLEGRSKVRYVPGDDSTGASLSETVEICKNLGMYNGINLDGGGSSQILIDNKRTLRISDRDPMDNSEHERAVPLGLYAD